jgi:hypothetical protein
VVEPKGFPKEFSEFIAKEKLKYKNETERRAYLNNKSYEIFNESFSVMTTYIKDTLAPRVIDSTDKTILKLKTIYSNLLKPDEIIQIAKSAVFYDYAYMTIPRSGIDHIRDFANIEIYSKLEKNENYNVKDYYNWFRDYYNKFETEYNNTVYSKMNNALKDKSGQAMQNYCINANTLVRRKLQELEPIIRNDPKFLNQIL